MKKIKLYSGIYLVKERFLKNQIYYFLETPKISVIIPQIKNKFLVISQKRIPIKKKTYEFPGGLLDKGDSAVKSAIKELYEETGYKSLSKPKKILRLYPDPGRLKSEYICFIIKKIKKIKIPEKGIEIHLLTKNQIINLIKLQKFSHACHISAFLFYINQNKYLSNK